MLDVTHSMQTNNINSSMIILLNMSLGLKLATKNSQMNIKPYIFFNTNKDVQLFILSVCACAFMCLICIVSAPGSPERRCDKCPLLLLLLLLGVLSLIIGCFNSASRHITGDNIISLLQAFSLHLSAFTFFWHFSIQGSQ